MKPQNHIKCYLLFEAVPRNISTAHETTMLLPFALFFLKKNQPAANKPIQLTSRTESKPTTLSVICCLSYKPGSSFPGSQSYSYYTPPMLSWEDKRLIITACKRTLPIFIVS